MKNTFTKNKQWFLLWKPSNRNIYGIDLSEQRSIGMCVIFVDICTVFNNKKHSMDDGRPLIMKFNILYRKTTIKWMHAINHSYRHTSLVNRKTHIKTLNHRLTIRFWTDDDENFTFALSNVFFFLQFTNLQWISNNMCVIIAIALASVSIPFSSCSMFKFKIFWTFNYWWVL